MYKISRTQVVKQKDLQRQVIKQTQYMLSYLRVLADLEFWSAYLCNLHTPVEEVLRADVVLVLSDVIQEAAIRHQLCDQLNS